LTFGRNEPGVVSNGRQIRKLGFGFCNAMESMEAALPSGIVWVDADDDLSS
jgi:hypothetical protein